MLIVALWFVFLNLHSSFASIRLRTGRFFGKIGECESPRINLFALIPVLLLYTVKKYVHSGRLCSPFLFGALRKCWLRVLHLAFMKLHSIMSYYTREDSSHKNSDPIKIQLHLHTPNVHDSTIRCYYPEPPAKGIFLILYWWHIEKIAFLSGSKYISKHLN